LATSEYCGLVTALKQATRANGLPTGGISMRRTMHRSLLLASLSPLALAAPATAQPNAQTAQNAPDTGPPVTTQPAPTNPANVNTGAGANQANVNADQIVITGTRRTGRTVTNSASPVDVITSNEITSQPTANLLDTVKNLVPSFYVPSNAISDASTFVRAPSLRGLPGDETLVQINGKRMNRSA